MSELFPGAIETERLRFEVASPEAVDLFAFYEVRSSDPDIEVERFDGGGDCRLRNERTTATPEPVDAIRFTITHEAYTRAAAQTTVEIM